MINTEINELLNDVGEPCVSIVIPMHRLSGERTKDPIVVKHIIENAKTLLEQRYSNSKYDLDSLIQKVNNLVSTIDFTHSKEGIGLYVSARISKKIHFPFQVVEKIKVGEKFDSRDLLFYLNSIPDYFVLAIGKEHVNLFSGKGSEIFEVKNQDFPIHYVEKFEYAKSNIANSFNNGGLQNFEHDKSVMEETRLITFLRSADNKLGKYLNGNMPLIISGGKKEIADYLELTQHMNKIVGKADGNYYFNGNKELGTLASEQFEKHTKEQHGKLLLNLHELIGKQLLAIGVEQVWRAAMEGKGLELVVEKDFEGHAYLSIDGLELKCNRPTDAKKYIYISDAVERIIKTVLEKNGSIVFVENGAMKEFNGIALQLRYAGVQY